jgi:hypothetical protein
VCLDNIGIQTEPSRNLFGLLAAFQRSYVFAIFLLSFRVTFHGSESYSHISNISLPPRNASSRICTVRSPEVLREQIPSKLKPIADRLRETIDLSLRTSAKHPIPIEPAKVKYKFTYLILHPPSTPIISRLRKHSLKIIRNILIILIPNNDLKPDHLANRNLRQRNPSLQQRQTTPIHERASENEARDGRPPEACDGARSVWARALDQD